MTVADPVRIRKKPKTRRILSIRARLLGSGLLLLLALLVASCAGDQRQAAIANTPATGEQQPALTPVSLTAGERLRVVATTSIIGDVVRQIGDDLIELTVLIGPGQDPHGYTPTAQDIAAIADAHVVFINGLGLEEGLQRTIETVREPGQPIIAVSAAIKPRTSTAAEAHEDQGQPRFDPHTWLDPLNVLKWVDIIERTLSELDPAHAPDYARNATAYREQLRALDEYIRQQVARIPPERRKLVMDHLSFGYFAARYGFEEVGSVIPGFSTAAEPSAADMARLSALMRQANVPVIFVSRSTNPRVTETLAREAGVPVLSLYVGSLGEPGSGADTYIGMMRANVDTIVKGLSTP